MSLTGTRGTRATVPAERVISRFISWPKPSPERAGSSVIAWSMPRFPQSLPAACTHSPSTRVRQERLRRRAVGFRSAPSGLLRVARHGAAAAERGDAERRDPVATAPEYLETKSVEGEALSRFRNRARLVDDEAGDRGRLLVRQAPVHRAVEIADRHPTVDIDRAVELRRDPRHRDVVLILDVATISSRM